jgi:hypothetical protein
MEKQQVTDKDDEAKRLMDLLPLLKGPALSILCALRIFSTLSVWKLTGATGYSDKTILSSLIKLRDLDLVSKISGRWVLTTDIFDFGEIPYVRNNSLRTDKFHPEKFRTYGESSSTATAINPPRTIREEVVVTEKNSDSQKAKVLQLLNDSGIHGSKAEELKDLSHMKIEYVKEHLDYWKRHPNLRAGLVITRMEHNEPVPREEKKLNAEKEAKSYIDGPFAEYVNH